MPEYKRLKQYGLPRSGTNAAKDLIERYCAVEIQAVTGGNKHMVSELPRDNPGVDGVIVSVKDPYAWLWSNWQRTAEAKVARLTPEPYWSDWLRGNYPAQIGGRNWWLFKNPVERWNKMNWLWLNLHLPTMVVKAESLLTPEGAERVVDMACQTFGCQRLPGEIKLQAKRFQPVAGEPVSVTAEDFKADYYLDRRYLSVYDQRNMEFVAGEVDWDLAGQFRYENPLVPEAVT